MKFHDISKNFCIYVTSIKVTLEANSVFTQVPQGEVRLHFYYYKGLTAILGAEQFYSIASFNVSAQRG